MVRFSNTGLSRKAKKIIHHRIKDRVVVVRGYGHQGLVFGEDEVPDELGSFNGSPDSVISSTVPADKSGDGCPQKSTSKKVENIVSGLFFRLFMLGLGL